MKGLIRDLDENLDDEVMRDFQCVLSSSFLILYLLKSLDLSFFVLHFSLTKKTSRKSRTLFHGLFKCFTMMTLRRC